MASTVEIGCSLLLILAWPHGRHAADARMIVTIQLFVYPQAGRHLVWGSILLFLLTRGAGAVSLDRCRSRAARERAAGEQPQPPQRPGLERDRAHGGPASPTSSGPDGRARRSARARRGKRALVLFHRRAEW